MAQFQQAKNTNVDKIPGKVIDYFNEYLDKETKKLSESK